MCVCVFVGTQTDKHTQMSGLLSLWGLSIGVMGFLQYKPYFLLPYTNTTGNFLNFYIFKKLLYDW